MRKALHRWAILMVAFLSYVLAAYYPVPAGSVLRDFGIIRGIFYIYVGGLLILCCAITLNPALRRSTLKELRKILDQKLAAKLALIMVAYSFAAVSFYVGLSEAIRLEARAEFVVVSNLSIVCLFFSGILFLKERASGGNILGGVIAFAGGALILGAIGYNNIIWMAVAFVCLTALAETLIKNSFNRNQISPLMMVMVRWGAVSVSLIGYVANEGSFWPESGVRNWGAFSAAVLILLALFLTRFIALAGFGQHKGMELWRYSAFGASKVIMVALVDFLVEAKSLSTTVYIGTGIIAVGIYLAFREPRRKRLDAEQDEHARQQ